MFIGRPPRIAKFYRGRTNAPAPQQDLHPGILALPAEALEIGIVHLLEGTEVRDEEGVAFELGGIPDEVGCLPLHGAYRKIVIAKGQLPPGLELIRPNRSGTEERRAHGRSL